MTDAADSYRDRSVLVTGATGIVGSWLIKALLAQGARVVALIRDEPVDSELVRSGDIHRVTRVHGELENSRLVGRALVEYEVDVVFHLGAQSQVLVAERDPLHTLEANVRGTYNVVDAVRAQGDRVAVVIASSDKAYGESAQLPYVEEHPLAGRGIYDASKSAADLISSSYARSFGLRLSIARCGNIYGGGDTNWDRLIPGTIRALLRGEVPVIRSDGRPRRDYLYVKDAVNGYLVLGAKTIEGAAGGEAFNFGNGIPVSVMEIVTAIGGVVGVSEPRTSILDQAKLEIPDQYLDASKAQRDLGWSATYDLKSGLSETVAWYRGLLDA